MTDRSGHLHGDLEYSALAPRRRAPGRVIVSQYVELSSPAVLEVGLRW